MPEEQLQFTSPLAYVTHLPTLITCNSLQIRWFLILFKKPPKVISLKLVRSNVVRYITLFFDVDVIFFDS